MLATDPAAAGATPASRILVVDDEAGVRELLTFGLEQAGHTVVTVATGAEALGAAARATYATALVDIHLPDADGLGLCRRLREEFGMEVILMTGDSQTYSFEDGMSSGASDFIVKPVIMTELVQRVRRAIEARQLREAHERGVQELRRLAIMDSLTELYNARQFFQQILVESARARRYGRNLSLVLLDLDNFKRLNDRHGHLEGDRALQQIGVVLRAHLRASDTAYRYGGEEFIVILPETAGAEAMVFARRLREAIPQMGHTLEDGSPYRLTASIGVAEMQPGEDVRHCLARADRAMYTSKQNGRNQVSLAPDGPIAPAPDEQDTAGAETRQPNRGRAPKARASRASKSGGGQ